MPNEPWMTPQGERVILPIEIFAAQYAINDRILSEIGQAQVETYRNEAFGQLIMTVTKKMVSSEHKTVVAIASCTATARAKAVATVEVPKTGWDWFKRWLACDMIEGWMPITHNAGMWLLGRVKWDRIVDTQVDVQTEVGTGREEKVYIERFCPHIAVQGQTRHLEFLTIGEPVADAYGRKRTVEWMLANGFSDDWDSSGWSSKKDRYTQAETVVDKIIELLLER